MIYTIGTALNRAQANDIPVQILVEGAWITGRIVAVDGHGVVLNSEDGQEHSVVRIQNVSAVKIGSVAPIRTPIATGAYSMPGPRSSFD